jgi:hypothetical protein
VQPEGAQLPPALEPWKDQSLTPEERLHAYKDFVIEKVSEILAATDRVSDDPAKVLEIRDAPETQLWLKEGARVKEVSAEEFCRRMDYRASPLKVAEEIVASYKFDKSTGLSTFTIPAGISDIEAMKGVNEYFRKHLPWFARGAIDEKDFKWYANLPVRDTTQQREVAIIAVVKGTKNTGRAAQEKVLATQGLYFADMRDQVLAAALHACVNGGEDLYRGLWVCGSVPGFFLCTYQDVGVDRFGYADGSYAASGSPFPE